MGALHRYEDVPLIVLRLVIGLVFVAHGWRKLVDGKGFAERAGRPQAGSFMTFLGSAEVAGAIAMFAGFLAQLAALGLSVIMVGAIALKLKSRRGFAPEGTAGTGWSYDAMILAGLVAVLFFGPGRWSVDALLPP